MNLETCMDQFVITIPYKLTLDNLNESDWIFCCYFTPISRTKSLTKCKIPTQKNVFTLLMAKVFPKYYRRNSTPVHVLEVSRDSCIPCYFFTRQWQAILHCCWKLIEFYTVVRYNSTENVLKFVWVTRTLFLILWRNIGKHRQLAISELSYLQNLLFIRCHHL